MFEPISGHDRVNAELMAGSGPLTVRPQVARKEAVVGSDERRGQKISKYDMLS
jgi:hypothetical protein